MNTLDIVLLAIAAALVVVVVVGSSIARRRADATAAELLASLTAANGALAQAHAEDNGWAREALEAAAHKAAGSPAGAELHLVQVIDRPGIENDEAVYSVVEGGQTREIRLARTPEGDWVAQ